LADAEKLPSGANLKLMKLAFLPEAWILTKERV
jgi:hypothetical protein